MSATVGRPVRVAIVDRDDISRRGMAAILADSPLLEVLGAATHRHALLGALDLRDADVLLINAVDELQLDQFAGVSVIEHLTAAHPGPRPTTIVLTDHYFDSALRRRIREAHADHLYPRAALRTASALHHAIEHHHDPRPGLPDDPDPDACYRHGVTEFTRVNRGVAFALEHDLTHTLTHRSAPRSRHWQRLRRDFNQQARLLPVTTDGCIPDRTQDLPSLPQIARFLTWATRIKLTDPPTNPQPSDALLQTAP